MKTIAIKTFPILSLCLFLTLALGFASCSNDENKEKEPENTETTISITINHPQYSNGALNVIKDQPITIDTSHIEVSINPLQEYTVEFRPESNDYFTFTAEGVLTGLKAGTEEEEVGTIIVRVKASSGKSHSENIPVKIVGMLVVINGNRNYVNDTFRVTAPEEFLLRQEHVNVDPWKEEYRKVFVPKTTPYFTFYEDGKLEATLDGVGTIEVLVLSGADTLKKQAFNVKVSPNPEWVTAVKVKGRKTEYFIPDIDTEKPRSLKDYFTVEGSEGVNKTLRFSSSNTNVATVDETTGEVTVKNVRSYAFIRATATDGSQRADSIRVTTAAQVAPAVGTSCDFNLCNILIDDNTKENQSYVSCKSWDGDVATSWVYKLTTPFPSGHPIYGRYPSLGANFLMGVYGKKFVDGDYNEKCSDWVLGGPEILKENTNWAIWAGGTGGGNRTFKKVIITRGFYTNEHGRKIYQSGTMYAELWEQDVNKIRILGKKPFTGAPNDNEWEIDLTQGEFDTYVQGNDGQITSEGKLPYSEGIPARELQIRLSAEGATANDGGYYFAIAEVLFFE